MSMDKFAIAGIQIGIPSNPDADGYNNIARMELSLIDLTAIYPWVNMAVFSELCTFGPLTAYSGSYAYALEQFCKMAAKYNIWLIPGTLYEERNGKIYNSAPVIRPDGTVQGVYRKMFPWYPYEAGVSSGDEFFTFEIENVGKFGVLICYDAWQPELWRSLACEGVGVVLNPTMTDGIDIPVEKAIVSAMAAINQMYIFHVNGFGGTAGTCGWGESLVAGPDGFVIHQAGAREEIFPVEINLERVVESRVEGLRFLDQSLKSFRDRPIRRYAVYDEQPDKYSEYLAGLGELKIPPKRVVS